MKLRSLKSLSLACLTAVGLSLGACQSTALESSILNVNKKVNISQRSYEAADVLIRQSQGVITLNTPVIIGTLSDVSFFETSTPLGRLIPEQIGTRFAQLGYNVQEIKLRNTINVNNDPESAGEFLTSRNPREISGEQQAGAVITGTYAVSNKTVHINLKLVETATSRVISAYDYTMDVNKDIKDLVRKSGSDPDFFDKKGEF